MRWGFTTFVEHAPGQEKTNSELFGEYDVERRTHILSRNIADPQETPESIADAVIRTLLAKLKVKMKSCGALVLCSSMHDVQGIAEEVKRHAQVPGPAIGVNYACTGFPAAVEAAMQLTNDRAYMKKFGSRSILLVASETVSRLVNWDDKNTAILFGDRAAATTIVPGGYFTILDAYARVFKDDSNPISLSPPFKVRDEQGGMQTRACMVMNGRQVFTQAPERMVGMVAEVFAKHEQSISPQELSTVVAHQANGRILDLVAQQFQRRNIGNPRVINRIHRMGNVASASIPATLAAMQEEIPEGTLVACPAFGAGPNFEDEKLTEGIVLMRAGMEK